MLCKACKRIAQPSEIEDCFEKAIDIIKHHYTFYKNALQQRDLELQQIKERNEKLNKALQPPTKESSTPTATTTNNLPNVLSLNIVMIPGWVIILHRKTVLPQTLV
ncbi:uncharacterized protein LOC119615666 [Lucilia sericata]|uniref:uncharacterized protein LOC119615666 n=1 Tax=Lucilia sericata TaxID=13632 RepID=UPI0018A81326|nr:uncharacterized protein LOC119615666 [Lucilia sericata]